MADGLFSPNINGTTVLTPGTAAAVGTIAGVGGALLIRNTGGTNTAFVDLNVVNTGTAAVATSMPIPAGATAFLAALSGTNYIQHITSTGTTTLAVTRGNIT